MTRVVLGDDHALVRAGIRALLDAAGIDVVSEAGDGREFLHAVRAEKPDIALADLSMPLLDGLEATRQISTTVSETRVIVLSMYGDAEYVRGAREAGAWGYVVKDDAARRLIDVIERVAAGENCLPADTGSFDDPLTPREREVLQLIVEGRKSDEIATIMNRSVHTVRNHRARLMRKLAVNTAADLVRVAEERGLTRLAAPGRKTS